MLIKCKYCGREIEDNNIVCPFCGKELEDEKVSKMSEEQKIKFKGTPRTIEELKAWYKSKNLPPYEVTRFFIGQNHVGPKAFGIYQDEDKFVVYKNKADGSRAIRYEGPNQAKAVNELYLKLKQEIANQKKVNNQKRTQKRLIIGFIVGFSLFALLGFGINAAIDKNDEERSRMPNDAYYWYQNTMYYCDGYYGPDWWKYDETKGDYYLYQTIEYTGINEPEKYFPDGMTNDNSIHNYSPGRIYDQLYPKGKYRGGYYDKYYIYNSHNYIDAGHHYPPHGNGYYAIDDNIYYYLDDRYSYYVDYDDGWYIYDNGDWIYYSDPYVHDTLGDYLWYSPDDYYVGETIDDYYSGVYDGYDGHNEWVVDTSVSDFENTDYYSGYENAYTEYEIEREAEAAEREKSSFWDSFDSDSDWSSSDSWDSGSTDWGSDW